MVAVGLALATACVSASEISELRKHGDRYAIPLPDSYVLAPERAAVIADCVGAAEVKRNRFERSLGNEISLASTPSCIGVSDDPMCDWRGIALSILSQRGGDGTLAAVIRARSKWARAPEPAVDAFFKSCSLPVTIR